MPGCLYLVATPIGTFADLSARAQEVLKSVHFIACEDTRHTRKLTQHFGISTKLVSLHEHNERTKSSVLVARILEGHDCALVSDAGTPAICDPGALFVAEARAAGIQVQTLPGPSSLISAVAASGFLQPRILFSGFLERNCADEFEVWRRCAPCIATFFESPRRILASLGLMHEQFGDQVRVSLSREISKQYEEHMLGFPEELRLTLSARPEIRGEFVVCVEIVGALLAPEHTALNLDQAAKLALKIHQNSGKRLKEIAGDLAQKHGLSAKQIYQKLMEHKSAGLAEGAQDVE